MTSSTDSTSALMRRTKAELAAEVVALRGRTRDLEKGITEHKGSAAAVRDSEERLISLLDESPIGVAITKNSDGRVVFGNDRMADMFGIERFSLVGTEARDFYDDEDELRQMLIDLQRDGGVRDREVLFKRKDGRTLWALLTTLPFRYGDEAARISWFFDITERKRAEEELRKLNEELERRVEERTRELTLSQATLNSITDQMPFALSLKDNEGVYQIVNRTFGEWFQKDPADMIGKPSSLENPLDQRSMFSKADTRVIQTQDSITLDYTDVKPGPDGDIVRDFQVTKFPIMSDDGTLHGIGTLQADITERKRAEDMLRVAKAEAEEAARVKANFLLTMSHNLRTPLNHIIGYSDILLEEAEDAGQPDMIADLTRIGGAGRNLLVMIGNILDLSDIETGTMEVAIEDFDLAGLIAEVETTAAPAMAANGNELEVNVDAGVGTMRSDRTKIGKCLNNLLSNAAKFTEEGRVDLAVGRDAGDRLAFRITDTGAGMSPDEHAGLFEAFAQADDGVARSFEGAGLGLAITKRFCDMLGGDVAVESEVGKGSTFTITLPSIVSGEA